MGDDVQKKQPMNSYVLLVRMAYQICTHESVHSFIDGVVTGDFSDIQDHCDNLSSFDDKL